MSRSRRIFVWGRQHGVRIDQTIGPYASLGGHIHFWPPREAHIDFHLIWWLVTIGRHYHG